MLKPRNLVLAFQATVCNASSHVLALPIAVGFLAFWLGTYYGSRGQFDPGLGLGNMIINASGWIISIATCSLAARAATHPRDEALHDKIDLLHEKVGITNTQMDNSSTRKPNAEFSARAGISKPHADRSGLLV